MRKSVYDQYSVQAEKLVNEFPSLMAMARHFTSSADMADALGFTGGGSAVNHWFRGSNLPGRRSEKTAKIWLDANSKQPSPEKPVSRETKTGAVLMVACPDGLKDRAIKILAMIGCEVVEI